MNQLNPQEKFIIARQLEDSSDTTSYYVKAIIKKNDGTVIDTVFLVDRGSQFFSKEWEVPKDETGNGCWITIQTFVYDDAGYSTISILYGTRLDTYLIQERVNANIGTGGAGVDVSYKKIRDIVREEIGKIEIPKQKELNIEPIINSVLLRIADVEFSLLENIKNIKIPEIKNVTETIDVSKIISEIKKIKIEKPESYKNELSDISRQLDDFLKSIQTISKILDIMSREDDDKDDKEREDVVEDKKISLKKLFNE